MLQLIWKVPTNISVLAYCSSKTMSEIRIVRKARYDGRVKKRQWEERRSDKGAGLDGVGVAVAKKPKTDTEVTGELIERIKRRKFALLLGYSGVGYFGMQRNPHTKTIEEDFFQALKANSYITDEGFTQVQQCQFQRAARTDKGVSAARQVVSMKLPEKVDIEQINNSLPEVIRVFGIKRVTKGFNSKSQCDSRSYTYILPTVVFIPYEQMMVQKDFRLPDDVFDRINQVLQKYIGTKNFHNFTSKKKPLDPSAKRYMKSFICETPFVRDDVEFAVLRVQGQSFMLHQIRKMIGLLIAIVKGCADEKLMDVAFLTDKINIPKAPGLGLVLDYVHYDRYNYRYGEDGVHDKLTWDEVENVVNDFKEKYIYPTIINTELKEEPMIGWVIRKLSGHKYDDIEKEDDEEDEKSDDNEQKVKIENT